MDGFLNLIIEVWNQDFLGISIGNVVISLIIIVTSLILRALIISRVFKFLENLAKETETEADDILLETLERPIGNVPLALGLYLIIELLPLSGIADVFLTNTVKALIAYTIFSVLTKAIGPIFELLAIKSWVTAALSMWLERFTRVLIWILAIAIILDIFGVEIGPIIAGLGLFSVAVALGAQDLFKNLISGILVLVERRFQVGDWIYVEGVIEGTVESIGFRSTVVRRFDKSLATIPNFQFAENAVINNTQTTNRRINWMIGLEYRTSSEQLKNIKKEIEDYIKKSDDFVKSEDTLLSVKIDQFAASSIDIRLICFTKTKYFQEWLNVKDTLALEIKNIVEKNKASFAFPSTSVYVEKNS